MGGSYFWTVGISLPVRYVKGYVYTVCIYTYRYPFVVAYVYSGCATARVNDRNGTPFTTGCVPLNYSGHPGVQLNGTLDGVLARAGSTPSSWRSCRSGRWWRC